MTDETLDAIVLMLVNEMNKANEPVDRIGLDEIVGRCRADKIEFLLTALSTE